MSALPDGNRSSSLLPSCRDTSYISLVAIAGGIAGMEIANLTAGGSAIGAMMCAGLFVSVSVLTFFGTSIALESCFNLRDNVPLKVASVAFTLLFSLATSFIVPSLLGFTITVGTAALVDLAATLVLVACIAANQLIYGT